MSLFAVSRGAGPAWVETAGAFDQPGVGEHAGFMNDLVAEGVVLYAGPLAGTETGGRIRVLVIADAESEAAVRQRLAADPWEVSGHIMTTGVEAWTVLAGALSK